MHLRELGCNDSDLLLRCSPLTHGLVQIREGLDVEHRADVRKKVMVKPHGFVDAQGLQERFVGIV